MLVPGVDLIEPLLRMQADRIQDAFFFSSENCWIIASKMGIKYAQTFHRRHVWCYQVSWGNGVNTFLKKECFHQFTVNVIWIRSGEEYLKKLDKGNEGVSNMLFVGMTYIISLATAGGMQFGNLCCVISDAWKSLFPMETKERTTWEKSSDFSMLENYFKTKGPAGFHGITKTQNGIKFSFINSTML